MKTLFLTRMQAHFLASDLLEYAKMQDKSNRDIFKGFKITFGDQFEEGMQPGEAFAMTPIPEYTEISKDADS